MSKIVKKNIFLILIILVLCAGGVEMANAASDVEDDVVRSHTYQIRINTTIANDILTQIKINTQTIIDKETIIIENTSQISARLAGTLAGAQADDLAAREELYATRLLLWQMTEDIKGWVNNTGNGNPYFVTNTGTYFSSARDKNINDMTGQQSDPALDGICEPFKNETKLGVGSGYETFEDKIACDPEVEENIVNFTEGDFVSGGSWPTFLKMTTSPQNNPMGAMIIVQEELDRRIEQKEKELEMESVQSGGFVNWENCEEYAAQADSDRDFDGCITETPGSVIANKLYWADTSTMRQLEVADNFNTIFYTTANKSWYQDLGSLSTDGLNNNQNSASNIGLTYDEYIAYINGQGSNNSNPGAVSPTDFDGDGYPNTSDPDIDNDNSPNNTDPNDYNPNIPTPGGPATACTVNFSQALATNNGQTTVNSTLALQMIECQLIIETNYLQAQSNISNLLDATVVAFNTSSCNATIKDSTISQINGTYIGQKELVWNRVDVNGASSQAFWNIEALNTAKTALQTNNPNSVNLVIGLSTTNFHSQDNVTSFQTAGAMFVQIDSWIEGRIDVAQASPCTVNTTPLAAWGVQ